jgi:hypothetical protein
VLTAGTDPTHIPGLGAVPTGEPEVAEPEPDEPSVEAADDEPQADDAVASEPADGAGEVAEEDEEVPEGPEFEVSDRRGSIVANGRGVTFTLDDTEARFRWSEIGAVEIGGSRFGRRFEIAVCTTDRHRFDAEVQASSRKQAQEWGAELDAVLDTWFEDGEDGED